MLNPRASLTVRVARVFQKIPIHMLFFLEWPFLFFCSKYRETKAVFIFALPRSGSTVTYQTLCHGLEVNYLSNFWNVFYQLPLIGGFFSGFFSRNHRSDFQSQYGFVGGLAGPAEGMKFWRWWLDCGLSDDECNQMNGAVRARRASYINRVFQLLTQRRPFATAYLGHSLVPDRVCEAFPGAVLVRLRRDPVSNALSLLKSLRAGRDLWFSVVPKECDSFKGGSEHERVASQVYWINRRLDSANCSSKMLTVHYEDLCDDPARELGRIKDWCHKMGVDLRTKFPLPSRFAYKLPNYHEDPDALKIRDALDKLEEVYGELEKGR